MYKKPKIVDNKNKNKLVRKSNINSLQSEPDLLKKNESIDPLHGFRAQLIFYENKIKEKNEQNKQSITNHHITPCVQNFKPESVENTTCNEKFDSQSTEEIRTWCDKKSNKIPTKLTTKTKTIIYAKQQNITTNHATATITPKDKEYIEQSYADPAIVANINNVIDDELRKYKNNSKNTALTDVQCYKKHKFK